MLAMEAQGGGRDARFNLGYNMSMLSGESSPDMYSGHGRASSSLNTAISRATMLPSSCNVGIPRGIKRTSSDVCFDQEVSGGRPMTSQPLSINTDISSDLVDDGYTQVQQNKKTPPPNGKKTKGRVKIKMEYIDNKLRRYTTFSKRKTGIMKKAYELSTLTGTQVMLLVASETGHVYTFATRKLQPMITSEAGKALIQTCLNSPDPAPSSVGGDQRMSATGFEETELTYNISDEEQKDDGVSSHSEDENSVGDGDSYGSGPDSPVVIENEEMTSPSSGVGVNGDDVSTPTTQPGVSAGLVSTGGYPGIMYQTSNGMMYAAPSSTLPNGVIFSLSPQIDPGGGGSSSRNQGNSRQQLITIPFPVLSANPSSSRDVDQEAADLSKNRNQQLLNRNSPVGELGDKHEGEKDDHNEDILLEIVSKMGCNSSSVLPLGETDIIDGAGIKVRVNPSTPETVKLSPNPEMRNSLPKKFSSPPLESSEPPVETLTKDFNTENQRMPPPPPLAFEVPVNEDSLIKKHPPKRFRRLEEQQTDNSKTLTHEWIDIKQQEAEMRRKEILSQRIQSAQQKNSQNRKLIHSDAFSQKSEDLLDWEKNM